MSSEIDQNLSAILEVEEPVVVETIEPEIVGEVVVAEEHPVATLPNDEETAPNRDVEYDYEYSRNLHRDLIEQGQEALPDLLRVARESQHPRAYEVASGFLKNLSDMADKLMILQKTKRELDGGSKSSGSGGSQTVNIDKAVFTGSTADLLKQIQKQ
jgi:hypothetical protein